MLFMTIIRLFNDGSHAQALPLVLILPLPIEQNCIICVIIQNLTQ